MPWYRTSGLMLLVFVLPLGAAWAQEEVTGTITATLGGEERTWSTLGIDTEEGFQATASWFTFDDGTDSMVVQGHPGTTLEVTRALGLDIGGFAEAPFADCPCSFDDGNVFYWTSESASQDLYHADDANVTLSVLEPVGEDLYRVEGTFEATLLFHESMADEPHENDSLHVEGTFTVERMPKLLVE